MCISVRVTRTANLSITGPPPMSKRVYRLSFQSENTLSSTATRKENEKIRFIFGPTHNHIEGKYTNNLSIWTHSFIFQVGMDRVMKIYMIKSYAFIDRHSRISVQI